MSLSEWSLRNIRPILFSTVALAIGGLFAYQSFPVSILPEVTFPRVVVVAGVQDMPQRIVEASITRPLEEAFASIQNVRRIRSRTKRGDTEISIDFAPETDIILAEQMVNTKVNQEISSLPAGTSAEVERMNPTVFPVLGLVLDSKSLSPTELWNLATYVIKPRLSRAESVARIEVQGGRVPEIEVQVRPNSLAAFGLTLDDVVKALSEQNQIRAVGRVDSEFKRYQVTVSGELRSLEDVMDTTVAERDGHPIRIAQLADVHRSAEDKTTVVSANGREAVLVNFIRQPNGNTIDMVDAVRKELKAMKSGLPADVSFSTFYDQSLLVREAIDSVRDAVLIGGALSVLVLLVFLRNWRATLVAASIIPLTLLVTMLPMRFAGLTLNLMTLGALAVGIGLIIDDAIVVVEAVFRNQELGHSIRDSVRIASGQIAAPMISSTLTTVVVFIPLAFLTGVAGAFFSALALTLAFALLVSLGLALFASPTMCGAWLKPMAHPHSGDEEREPEPSRLQRGYDKLLTFMIRQRWLVIPIVAATGIGTLLLAGQLQTGFMPAMDEGAFILDYWTPPGTSLDESDRLLKQVDKILMATPEVAAFSRRTGTELGFAITEPNRGDFAVLLKSGSRRHIEAIMKEVRAKIQTTIPGLDVEFIQVLQDLVGDLAGNPEPIELKLFGENQSELESLADSLSERLGQVPGIVDVSNSAIEAGPEWVFDVDPGKIGRVGMTTESVSSQAEAALNGQVPTNILEEDRLVPVRVRLPFATRKDPEAIGRTGIQTPAGRMLLQDLGTVRRVGGERQNAREDQRRMVAVTSQLEGIDLGTAIQRLRNVLAQTKLPPGVTTKIGGQYLSQQESFRNLTEVLGIAVVLVFTVMLFQFRSFAAPVIVLLLMPLALFGAVTALLICGSALNVSAFMGVIMLAGIVVKNGILLLDYAQRELDAHVAPEDAVLSAGRRRLRPILMTTLTAILGLVPLALGVGAGAEMQQPLAIAVIGGLAFSTVLTLVLAPTLFCWVRSVRPHRMQ